MGKGLFPGQASSLERLLALTDGIYAIVLTLLVLDLKIPEALKVSDAELVKDLVAQMPNFIAYFISFVVIVIFWMRNHWILKPLAKGNETVFWLNLFHLFFLSLIPYTSSLIGHYERDSLAVMFFSGSLGLSGLSLLFLHAYISRKPEWIGKNPGNAWAEPNWWLDYPTPIVALGSMGLAFININAALGIWVLAPIWGSLALVFRR